jgi:hypothetical protein
MDTKKDMTFAEILSHALETLETSDTLRDKHKDIPKYTMQVLKSMTDEQLEGFAMGIIEVGRGLLEMHNSTCPTEGGNLMSFFMAIHEFLGASQEQGVQMLSYLSKVRSEQFAEGVLQGADALTSKGKV